MASNTIQIFLRHHNDPKFAPQTKQCSDYEDRKGNQQKGCGATVIRFVTYPNEKGMYFDGDPIVVQQFPVRQDGAVIAVVSNENVHFATCTAKKQPRPTVPFDGKAAAQGGQ